MYKLFELIHHTAILIEIFHKIIFDRNGFQTHEQQIPSSYHEVDFNVAWIKSAMLLTFRSMLLLSKCQQIKYIQNFSLNFFWIVWRKLYAGHISQWFIFMDELVYILIDWCIKEKILLKVLHLSVEPSVVCSISFDSCAWEFPTWCCNYI